MEKAPKLCHQVRENKAYFISSSIFKSSDFNFSLNKEVSRSSFSVLDRTLLQSERTLINNLYFDL